MNKSGKKVSPDKDETVSNTEQMETSSLTVGQILKQERESRGLTLATVSKELMIRKFYLSALEEGRYVELPDTVYAVGFVKSYAELMGLEGGPLVSQFKRERGESTRTELNFPDPLQESKMPSKPVIIGGIAAATVILFLWAHIAGEDTINELETIPEPPQEMVEAPTTMQDASLVEEDESEANVIEIEEMPDAASMDAGIEDQPVHEETEAVAQNVPQPQVPLESTENAAQQQTAETVIAPQLPQATATPQNEATPRVERSENVISVPAPAEEGASNQTDYRAMRADDRQRDRAVASSSPSAEPEVINADPNRDSRVTIVASEEAWVEIRDRNGRLLLTRVLQAGQRYDVPDEKGVTMITGNAGGVYLIVDGKTMPPLGKPAAVKRNIRLDADLY